MPDPLAVQMVTRRTIIPRDTWEGIVDLGVELKRQPLELVSAFLVAAFNDREIRERIADDESKRGTATRPN